MFTDALRICLVAFTLPDCKLTVRGANGKGAIETICAQMNHPG